MAAKKAIKVKKVNKVKKVVEVVPEVVELKVESKPNFLKKHLSTIIGVLAVVFAVFGFWWKTNSWPIVAVVNYRPIWRFELNKQMFDQVGQQTLDGMISEKLIVSEISAKGINVSSEQVNAKYDQIKASFGDDNSFAQLMEMQGITEGQLKGQIKVQLGIEELIKSSTDSAMATDPAFMQDAAYNLVQDLRMKSKVWTIR